MITTNLSTLKINKLTQEQYDAAKTAGTLKEEELYLTPATAAAAGPVITYGTTDLTAGTSELAEGTFYFVYE